MGFLEDLISRFRRVPRLPAREDSGIRHVFITVPASLGADPALTRDSSSIKQLQAELQVALGARGAIDVEAKFGEIIVSASGPDADAIWDACAPVLRASPLTPHGFVLRSYDDGGLRQVQTTF